MAGVPDKPVDLLVSDAAVTNGERIKVSWLEPTEDGGATILSYSLEIDDGKGGDFTSLVGTDFIYLRLEYTVEEGIIRATNYRMRHRYRNQIGWSEYSDLVYILSATRPEKPPRPTMISTDSTSITLELARTSDDSGSPVSSYNLLVDDGDDFTSSFRQITRYSAF